MSRIHSSTMLAAITALDGLVAALPLDGLNKYELANLSELFTSKMRVQMSKVAYVENCHLRGIDPTAQLVTTQPKGSGPFGSTYTGD